MYMLFLLPSFLPTPVVAVVVAVVQLLTHSLIQLMLVEEV
jgi:hypothetical protein